MDLIGRGVGWGGAPESVDNLFQSAKVPPAGVGFCPARQPEIWGGVPPAGGGPGKYFLSDLFKGSTAEVPMRGIIRPTVKQARLEIPNLALSTWENWADSCVVIGHMVAACHRRKEFKTEDHTMILQEGRGQIRCQHMHNAQMALKEDMSSDPAQDSRT